MQNRADLELDIKLGVEFSSFTNFFMEHPNEIFAEPHNPPLQPIKSLHYHDALEIGYCIGGSGVFFVDGENIPFSGPHISVIYPGQLHMARSTGRDESRWVFFTLNPRLLEESQADEPPLWKRIPSAYALSAQEELLILGREIYREYERKERGYEACVKTLALTVLQRHVRCPLGPAEQNRLKIRALQKLRPALQYIDARYRERLSAELIAGELFVHPTTLRQWFYSALEQSPMQYVNRVRIMAACALLKGSDLPISDISAEVGFESVSTFNRQFRCICGTSPSEYRGGGHG